MANLGEVPFARCYGGVDTTPLFVALAGGYANRTGDYDVVLEAAGRTCEVHTRGDVEVSVI